VESTSPNELEAALSDELAAEPDNVNLQQRNERVFVGIPAIAGLEPEVVENLCSMFFHAGRRCPNTDFYLKIVAKKEQYRARNNIVNMAMGVDADWILFLDDDMVVPNDLYERLRAHDKDITGVLYWQRGGAYHPVILKRTSGVDGHYNYEFMGDFPRNQLAKVDCIGGGCMLIRTDIFAKMIQPYFWVDGIVGTDIYFCHRAFEAGIDVYCDTTIELGHMNLPTVITEKTIPQHRRHMALNREELLEDAQDYFKLNRDQFYDDCARAGAEDHVWRWKQHERESWEGYKDYYLQDPKWQVLRLIHYNLEFDHGSDYVFNTLDFQSLMRILPGKRVLDFGAGVGMCTIPMARMGLEVTSLDIEDSPYQKFLIWRANKHKLEGIGFTQALDFDKYTENQYDAVIFLGVMDHLQNPMEVLKRLHHSLAPGGMLVLDVNIKRSEQQPQHLMNYDEGSIVRDVERIGFRLSVDNQIIWERI